MYFSYLGHVTDNNSHDDSIDSDSFTEDDAGTRHWKSVKCIFFLLLLLLLLYTVV